MPITTMTARLPEVLRLRAGDEKISDKKPGKPLETWRATGHDETAVRAMAAIYGGTPKPWRKEWSVITEAAEVAVLLPPRPLGESPWYETWGSGGCQRRCDGERALVPVQSTDGGHLDEVPCVCVEQGKTPGQDRDACSVVLRLQVILADLPALGVALMTSSSSFAAKEMSAQLALVERAAPGAYVPASLVLDPREMKLAWEKFPRRFIVPTLRLRTSVQQLAALADRPLPEIVGAPRSVLAAATARPALEAGSGPSSPVAASEREASVPFVPPTAKPSGPAATPIGDAQQRVAAIKAQAAAKGVGGEGHAPTPQSSPPTVPPFTTPAPAGEPADFVVPAGAHKGKSYRDLSDEQLRARAEGPDGFAGKVEAQAWCRWRGVDFDHAGGAS